MMRVLAVDDDAVSRLIVQKMVRSAGYECAVAVDGKYAWEILKQGNIDVLISDRMMPGIDGLELCRMVRSELGIRYVYVILLTGMRSHDAVRDGMEAGADDYLVKPLNNDELALRLVAAERVTQLHRHLEAATVKLVEVARRDPMTGLKNRLQMQEDLQKLVHRVQRYEHKYCLALFDVDHFKQFNDLYGHLAGDEALRSVAGVLANGVRGGDSCYRFGGEEFLCIFPEQDALSGMVAVERMRRGVAELLIPHAGNIGHGVLTVSAGVAELRGTRDVDFVLREADAALYRAKELGRNLVEGSHR